jgi:hypothetical protein
VNNIGYIIEIYAGVLLSLFGFVIWHYDLVDIISGYDANKTKDKHGLAKWVGSNLIIMGVLPILVSVINIFYIHLNVLYSGFSLALIIFVFSIRTAVGCKKFER